MYTYMSNSEVVWVRRTRVRIRKCDCGTDSRLQFTADPNRKYALYVCMGEVASGDVASGDVASGDVASGDVASGEVASGPTLDCSSHGSGDDLIGDWRTAPTRTTSVGTDVAV